MTILRTILENMGWSHGETGGGCTAYTKTPRSSSGQMMSYLLMTVYGDPVAPSSARQLVDIGAYDKDGNLLYQFTVLLAEYIKGGIVL